METVQGLYGSTFAKSKACGYCKHHHCYLTVKQVKQHGCLGKQCWYLQKHEEHEWWAQRAIVKQQRRERKLRYM